MSDLLRAEKLSAYYGASRILFDVDLALAEKRTLALLGRNGAGKSTTMKTLAGVLPARGGRIFFAGRDITSAPPHVRARLGLAYVPEDRQVFPEHTVEDNLLIAAKPGPGGRRDWTVPRVWETFPLLTRLRTRQAGRLSGGEQQLLVIARALMGNPLVLLLDEPSEGLAPVIVEQIADVVRRIGEEGLCVLLVEQRLDLCLALASHVYVMETGRIVFHGTTEEFEARPEIRDKYLALEAAGS
jgi:branched-chain amino acid transport system ATP-binding protein